MSEPQRKPLNGTAVIIALIATIPATVASIATVVIALKTEAKVEAVHQATNGLTAKLESVTRSDALQEGFAKGAQDQKLRELDRKK